MIGCWSSPNGLGAMKLNAEIHLRKLNGQKIGVIMTPLGLDYTKVLELNASAAYLIEETKDREFTEEAWIALLQRRYQISHEAATKDVRKLIDALSTARLLSH